MTIDEDQEYEDDGDHEYADGEKVRSPWQAYQDRFPGTGDSRVRKALAWCNNQGVVDDTLSPIVLRALSDMLGDRYSSDRLLRAMDKAVNHGRPTYPLPDFVKEPRLGHHMNVGPVVEDGQRVEAIWSIDELVDQLEEMRVQLTREDLDEKRAGELVSLVRRVSAVLTDANAKKVTDDVLTAARRTFVLNITAIVIDLRLPAVVRCLADQGLLDRDLLEAFFAPLLADERTCILAVVRARFPPVADELERMEVLHRKLLERWRDSSRGSKWPTAAELFGEIGLWDIRSNDLSSRKETLLDEQLRGEGESLRSTYQRDKPACVGDLTKPRMRRDAWGRLANYVLTMGLGNISVEQFEAARSKIDITG